MPGLTLLYHPDLERVGERLALPQLEGGREILLSRLEPEFSQPGQGLLRPLADTHVSRRPLRLAPAEEGGVSLRASSRGPRIVADGRPFSGERTFSREDLERGVVLLLAERVVLLLHTLDPSPPEDVPHFGLVGESRAMLGLRRAMARVADLPVPVLLRGETGTGKELVARALHHASPRRGGPYVTVNMAAIPPALAASELFGSAKGAFTGADRPQAGYFSRAETGSLFLDEVGEMPPEVQNLLLRALETREIQPVGAETVRRVNVRLIAATDSDLEAAISEGRFRAPLLHRLSSYEIRLPPLRQRRDDLGRLLLHFLRSELATVGEGHRLQPGREAGRPWLPAPLVAQLAALAWPGNVRQLKNVAREMAIGSRGREQVSGGPQLERLLQPPGRSPPAAVTAPERKPPRRRPSEIGEEELVAALRAHRFRLKPTASELGLSRSSLYDLIDRFPRVRRAADLGRDELAACLKRCGGDLDAMVDELEVSKDGIRQRLRSLGLARDG